MEKEQNKICVSVLMFVYNHEHYLRKAIESVVRQKTNFLYEVIIHDDASTDDSKKIILEYAEKYPDLIVPILQTENQMQQGISISDRYLMPSVRGKYIAFCEGDDYWLSSHKLQTQFDFLEAHEEYAAVSHNCKVIDENGNPQRPVRKFFPFRKPYTYTLKDLILEDYMPGQTASVMYRYKFYTDMHTSQRDAYQKIRYCVGDRRRTLLILLNRPFYCMNRTMSAYRYVTAGGGSWNARTHGKNLSGKYYIQERDFRRFSKEYYHTVLRNDYVLFGTGLMAALRFLAKPNKENREQFMLIRSEHKSLLFFFGFMCRIFPGALWTLIKRTMLRFRKI